MADAPKTVVEGHAPNLETIIKAAKRGDLALMECKRVSDGKIVAVLCCVGRQGNEYIFAPMAEMFEDNPYEQWLPPEVVDAGGTVHPVKDAIKSVIELAETWISERESPLGSWVEDHAAIALLKKTFELEEKSDG